MSYETKVILIAIGNIIQKAESIDEIFELVQEMANAEGVILKRRKPKNEENGS